MAARNMYRIEINIHKKELYVELVIYRDKVSSKPAHIYEGVSKGSETGPID